MGDAVRAASILSGVEGAVNALAEPVEAQAARASGELMLTKYYYVNGLRVAQARKAGSAAWVWTWYHSDHLGSATVLADKDGNAVRRLAYRAFGEEIVNTGAGDAPPYTYTGKERDSSGLMYYGARYYDPALGRFITPDTVYDQGTQGLNHYSYALNNPIKYNDPTGHWSMFPPDFWKSLTGQRMAQEGQTITQALDNAIERVNSPLDSASAWIPTTASAPCRAPLFLIKNYRSEIRSSANAHNVLPQAIASIIFQEKYYGIAAFAKNVPAVIDGTFALSKSANKRSFGLAEMQIRLAANLLAKDVKNSEERKEVVAVLKNNIAAIDLIARNIASMERGLGRDVTPAEAVIGHNMGIQGLTSFLAGKKAVSGVAQRSLSYQISIAMALSSTGETVLKTDTEWGKFSNYYNEFLQRSLDD